MKLRHFNMTNCEFDYNAFNWTPFKLQILEENWKQLTAAQLAKALNVSRTIIRMKLYELGYKKIEMEYWTPEQEQFLRDNYKTIGDVELAEIFDKKWPKDKKWTKSHIDKKRGYLKLVRTDEDLAAVMQRNVDQGRMNLHNTGVTNWLTTGPAKQGEIRMYKSCHGVIQARVKVGKRWDYWPRWRWNQLHGKPPAGYVVVMKDANPFNTVDDNLEIVTKSEAAKRYVAATSKNLTDNYVAAMIAYGNQELRAAVKLRPDLIETSRVFFQLKRTLKKVKNGEQQSEPDNRNEVIHV
jgi:hypothetical protein